MLKPDDSLLSDRQYDVFISYSHADAAWVRDELLPSLERAQLRVIIDTEFAIGRKIDDNIADAINNSCRTLVVLTPAWVDSDWTAFELALAGLRDPASRDSSIVPILLADCEVPPRLRLLTYGDFRIPADRPHNMKRLLKALGGRDTANGAVVSSGPARRALVALHELLKTPEIRSAAAEFRGAFEGVCARIDPVVRYKRMHDLLHQLEFDCYDRIRNNKKRFADADDEFAYQEMASCLSALEAVARDLQQSVSAPAFEASNAGWVSELGGACGNLRLAIDNRDPALLTSVTDAIGRILQRRPSQINSYLVEAARALRLNDLVTAMCRLHGTIVKLEAESVRSEEFRRGIVALGELAAKLDGLIRIHTIWQEIDYELNPIETVLAHSIARGDFSWWRNLKDLTANLDTVAPAAGGTASYMSAPRELNEWRARLDGAIADGIPKRIKDSFWRFQRLAKTTFRSMDDALKRQCDELPQLFSPLATVEEVLR
jgi:TIR domain